MATAVAFSTFRDSSATGATGAFPIMSLSVDNATAGSFERRTRLGGVSTACRSWEGN
jgi:hypothetical protein